MSCAAGASSCLTLPIWLFRRSSRMAGVRFFCRSHQSLRMTQSLNSCRLATSTLRVMMVLMRENPRLVLLTQQFHLQMKRMLKRRTRLMLRRCCLLQEQTRRMLRLKVQAWSVWTEVACMHLAFRSCGLLALAMLAPRFFLSPVAVIEPSVVPTG